MSTATAVVRRALVTERRLYACLLPWLRRRPDVPPGATALGYHRAAAPVLWTFVVLSLVELVVLHLVIPWEPVRWAADVVGVWGLLWMLAFLASFSVRPHLLTDEGVRVRMSVYADLLVPWDAVAGVGARQRPVEGMRMVSVDRADGGTVVGVPVTSQTTVDLELSRPLTLALPRGAETVVGVRFSADDPRSAVARIRERVGLNR